MFAMQRASFNLRCWCSESPAHLQCIMLISCFTVSCNPSAASCQQQHGPDQEWSREERVRQVQGPLQREGQEGREEGPQTSEYTSALGWVYKITTVDRGEVELCMCSWSDQCVCVIVVLQASNKPHSIMWSSLGVNSRYRAPGVCVGHGTDPEWCLQF